MGPGERDSLPRGTGSILLHRELSSIVYHQRGFCVNLSFLVPSLISIVAVNVCLLISLLLPVNCSYLNPWSLFLCLQFSFSSCCSGEREGKMGEQERGGGSLEGGGTELGGTIPKARQLHGPIHWSPTWKEWGISRIKICTVKSLYFMSILVFLT